MSISFTERSSDREKERRTQPSRGFTIIEVILATAIIAILMVGLGGVVTTTLAANEDSRDRNALARDAQLAVERMVSSVEDTSHLVLPLAENDSTPWSESIRDPGVLAVALDPTLDRDLDGFADADNDQDGAVDEDLPADANHDGRAGIRDIDDSGNMAVDFSWGGSRDDDEAGSIINPSDEDAINGLDDDGDGAVDEDPPADMNGDGAPGVALVDDDGDGSTDEGSVNDDDEDGRVDEDWLDTVVYFLAGSNLIERHPNLSPASGTDYTERVIAENVSRFRVERLPRGTNRVDLIEITLELSTEEANISLTERVRVGTAL